MRDGSQTKARIDKTAMTLFAKRGIRETTIRHIAKGAGITEGAIYRHYKSKDALATTLFNTHYTAFARVLRALAAREDKWQAKITSMISEICRMYDEERILFDFLLLTQHTHLGRIASGRDNPVDVVGDVFREAIAQGALSGEADLMAAVAFGLVVQPATFIAYGRLDMPLGAIHDKIAAAVLAAVMRL